MGSCSVPAMYTSLLIATSYRPDGGVAGGGG